MPYKHKIVEHIQQQHSDSVVTEEILQKLEKMEDREYKNIRYYYGCSSILKRNSWRLIEVGFHVTLIESFSQSLQAESRHVQSIQSIYRIVYKNVDIYCNLMTRI